MRCEVLLHMTERENPISVRSKRLITDALVALMEEKPFSKISIRDIVEKAGLTRQTFYHNFESKEEVLTHKSDELFDDFFQFLTDNQVTDLEGVICLYFRYWQDNDEFIKLLIKNNLVFILENRYPQYFDLVQLIYFRGKGFTNTETEYLYAAICGAIINLLVVWVRTGETMTPKEMSSFVMGLFEGRLYNLYLPKEEREERLRDVTKFKKGMS